MKIALIGYGKMGKAIEIAAISRGHEIVLKISSANRAELNQDNLSEADVAIEFTNPHSAVENLETCFKAGIPVVCGSTGWLDEWNRIAAKCNAAQGSLIYASNFSVGVNIFFELNKKLAVLMRGRKYDVSLQEVHHTQKKDAPSGTAISLAEQIIEAGLGKDKWVNATAGNRNELEIISKRIDPAPGTHSIKYSSPVDDIEIIHTAHNREGFATGAVLAAEFIRDKKGIFSMRDVLSL